MNSQGSLLACVLMLAAYLTSGLSSVQAADGDDTPLATQHKDGKENLFLLEVLEATYVSWPRADADPLLIQDWINGTRLRMTKLKKNAEVDGLNPHVIRLYEDCICLLDEYEAFLTWMGLMHGIANARQDGKEVVTIAADAFGRGGEVTGLIRQRGGGEVYALAAGGVVAVVSAAGDIWSRFNSGAKADDQQKREMERRANSLNGHFSGTLTGAQAVAEKLNKIYSWPYVPSFKMDDIQQAVQLQDDSYRKNPIVAVRSAVANRSSKVASTLSTSSRECVRAAEQVPSESEFDIYRTTFLSEACELALAACSEELKVNGYVLPAPTAPEAVRLYATIRSLLGESQVPDWLRFKHGCALMWAGRFQDARRVMAEVKSLSEDSNFAYWFAGAQSRTGETESALDWLRHSQKLGGGTLSPWVRNDPDFLPVQIAQPNEFNEIVPQSTLILNSGRAAGPLFHKTAADGDYLLGKTKVRFMFGTCKMAPMLGSSLPATDTMLKFARSLNSEPHVANTDIIPFVLEPETLLVLKLKLHHSFTSVYIYIDQTYEDYLSENIEMKWERLEPGVLHQAQDSVVPGYRMIIDVVRSATNAETNRPEINYRFIVGRQKRWFPVLTRVEPGGIADRTGLRDNDILMWYHGYNLSGLKPDHTLFGTVLNLFAGNGDNCLADVEIVRDGDEPQFIKLPAGKPLGETKLEQF